MINNYVPKPCKVIDIIKHTDIEWTFRLKSNSEGVKPGQFYEISMPKYGESPISVSGVEEDLLDFTIRKVGKVTDEIFKMNIGDFINIRGPYGNGFNVDDYKGKEILIVAGGSGLAPVRGILEYFYTNFDECQDLHLICGFKSPSDILFKEDIERWKGKFKVIATVDKETDGYRGHVGLVTKFIPELDIDIKKIAAVVVGPPLMMKFSIIELQKLGIKDKDIWVSYERKMSCGIGKCGHCRMDRTYICTDGPVFNYEFGKKLYD